MSPNYFSSLFKKEKQQSTVNYLIELRIRKAGDYLEHTKMSVADIARTVGYEDSQYFFRVFKKRPADAVTISAAAQKTGIDNAQMAGVKAPAAFFSKIDMILKILILTENVFRSMIWCVFRKRFPTERRSSFGIHKDVARQAGVAISTVSKVLNGYEGVSESTKDKVNAAIEALNYTPNAVAAALSSKQQFGRVALLLKLEETVGCVDEINL